jgi:hypothetical protein
MSDNTLMAIVFCGFFVFASIAVASSESEHEKVMKKIEEKKALLELEGNVETKEIKHWVDSMKVEINKR